MFTQASSPLYATINWRIHFPVCSTSRLLSIMHQMMKTSVSSSLVLPCRSSLTVMVRKSRDMSLTSTTRHDENTIFSLNVHTSFLLILVQSPRSYG